MNCEPPQKSSKRRRDSYGPSGSFVASDDDDGDDEANDAETVPFTRMIKVKRRSSASAQERSKKRVDRILAYAELYKGWSTGVMRHFGNWILEQELKSVSGFSHRP
jgi:hypothetical protein